MLKPDLEGVKKTLQEYPYPVDVIVEVTNYCNLRCIMCPYPNLERKGGKGEMKFETFKKIADEVSNENKRKKTIVNDCKNRFKLIEEQLDLLEKDVRSNQKVSGQLSLTRISLGKILDEVKGSYEQTRIWLAIMGEPLLIKDRLIEMIKYAKAKDVEVNLNTNAVFLTPEMSEKLIDTQVDYILVSIDAFTKGTYDKIRVGGDFNVVVKNTNALLSIKGQKNVEKPKVIAQFIEMDENTNEMEAFKDYWLDKGAIVKVRPKLGWGNAVKTEVLDDVKNDVERFPCAWLTRTVSIHWDGTMAQCDADHNGIYSPGDFNEKTIKEIWDSEIAGRRKRHWNGDFDFEPCKNCLDWLAGRSQFIYPDKDTSK